MILTIELFIRTDVHRRFFRKRFVDDVDSIAAADAYVLLLSVRYEMNSHRYYCQLLAYMNVVCHIYKITNNCSINQWREVVLR